MRKISDGPSKTLLAVAAPTKYTQSWWEGGDLILDELEDNGQECLSIAIADGSVRRTDQALNADNSLLKRLVQINDGQPIWDL